VIDDELGAAVVARQPVGGGDICTAEHLALTDGRSVFLKTRADAPPDFFTVEADGLRWLAAARAVAVPAVVAVGATGLALAWVPHGAVTTVVAEAFGRDLARLHRAGAPQIGAPRDGYIGRLPLDNQPAGDWPTFWWERRLEPYLRQAVERGNVDAGTIPTFDRLAGRLAELAGPPEPPARLHGDLWAGNVVWGADGRAWMVDPAAHGGHRETDLAMLALFGLPHPAIVAAYDETWPLAAGWRDRVGLHQLHPLLVHAVTHGAGYGYRAVEIARHYAGSGRPG
jgi:fructosamine-3-kinase